MVDAIRPDWLTAIALSFVWSLTGCGSSSDGGGTGATGGGGGTGGTGQGAPEVKVDVSDLEFGEVNCDPYNETIAGIFHVHNVGTAPLVYSTNTESMPEGVRVWPDTNATEELPPGTERQHIVYLQGNQQTVSPGKTFEATYEITSNDPAHPSIALPLSVIARGVRIVPLSATLAFGTVAVGDTSSKTLTVQVAGSAGVTVTPVLEDISATSSPVYVESYGSPKLADGDSLDITLVFAPLSPTTLNMTTRVTGVSGQPVCGPALLNLTGSTM